MQKNHKNEAGSVAKALDEDKSGVWGSDPLYPARSCLLKGDYEKESSTI